MVFFRFGLIALALSCGQTNTPSPAQALRAPEFGPVPPLPDWPGDPPSPSKIELGRTLFFDPRLSGSGHTSCDNCHGSATRFQDNQRQSVPDRSFPLTEPRTQRNTSSMLNLVFAPVFRWDGSESELVDAMLMPFLEDNMNLGQDLVSAQWALKQRLTEQIPGYLPLFQEAFAQHLNAQTPAEVWKLTGRALAAFMRRAISTNAPFDRWNAGDDSAMSEKALRGFELFRGRAGCFLCHSGPLFSDFLFHNVSTSLPNAEGKRADEGRFGVSAKAEDHAAFLTPTLRGAYDTQPYFHDGSVLFLRDAVRHFGSEAALADSQHDALLLAMTLLNEGELEEIVAFIGALRGEAPGEEISPPPDGLPSP